jgi:hypothetical protein
VELDESEVVMNHRIIPANKASPSLAIQIRRQGTDLWLSSPVVQVSPGQIYEARIDWTDHPSSTNMGQYVMEIGPGGSFAVDPTGHCEGHVRAWAQSVNDIVQFSLSSDTSITGAWAIGHSAVSLTPSVELHVTVKEVDPDL